MNLLTSNHTRLFVFFMLLIPSLLMAQVGINTDNSDPDASSLLDLKSTDKGLLIPRMTAIQRDSISLPATGLMVYVLDDQMVYHFDGTDWLPLEEALDLSSLLDSIPQVDYSCLGTVGSCSSGTNPYNIRAKDNYVFVSDDEADDIKTIDISEPNNPVIVASYSVNNSTRDMELQGDYLYLLDNSGFGRGLRVFDISQPDSLQQLGFFPTSFGNANAVALTDSIAYTANTYGVLAIDISRPDSLIAAGSLNLGTITIQSIVVSGNYAYVAAKPGNGLDDFFVIDVSEPDSMKVVASIDALSNPADMAFSGNYVYVADYSMGRLMIFDVQQANAPTLVSNLRISNKPSHLKVVGNYAFVTAGNSDALDIIDISDQANPVLAQRLLVGTFPFGIDVMGNYAYMTDLVENKVKVLQLGCNPQPGLLVDPFSGTLTTTNAFLQKLSLSQNLLAISDGNTIDLSAIDTDDQMLTLSGDSLFISEGNGIDLSAFADADDQTLSLSGTQLSIADGNTVDLAGIDTDTDDQTLNLSGTQLSIADGNTVNLASIDTDTDDQTLNLSGTQLSIADGNTVNLAGIDTDTDDQTLNLSGTQLSIADGNTVNLASIDTDTDDQTLNLSGTQLSIADGNSVDLASIDTDDQTLGLSGTVLSISGGNSVILTSLQDNLGDHTARNNIDLAGNWISNDGDNEGIRISNSGRVGIGTSSPNSALEVNGPIATSVTTISTNTVLNNSHSVVLCANTTNNIDVDLPSAIGIAGRLITLKKISTGSGRVRVSPSNGQTIDNSPIGLSLFTHIYVQLVSDGSNWWIISSN